MMNSSHYGSVQFCSAHHSTNRAEHSTWLHKSWCERSASTTCHGPFEEEVGAAGDQGGWLLNSQGSARASSRGNKLELRVDSN